MNKNVHYWTVPRVWEGSTVFVIGGGPSVGDHDLTTLHHQRVVGVNNAYQLGEWVDFVFFGDKKWWKWHYKELTKWPKLIVTNIPPDKLSVPNRVKRTQRRSSGWSVKQDVVSWNGNSGFAAINFAGLLGARRIVLIGFDMTSKASDKGLQYHWHPEHPAPVHLRTSEDDFVRFMGNVDHIVNGARKNGIELLNASLISAIPDEKIPKIDLQEFLKNETI